MMAYLDSELDARTTVEIGGHLSSCKACERRFAAEEQLERGLVQQLRAESCPPDVKQRLVANLSPRVPVLRRWSLWAAAAGVALTVLLVRELRSVRPNAPLQELAAADAACADAPLDLSSDDPVAISAYLEAQGLPLHNLPAAAAVGGHHFEWLGVRHAGVAGQSVPVIVGRCCGEPVSIFVMRRTESDSTLAQAGTDTLPGGPTVTLFSVGALELAVISRHDTSLTALLASA
jgi:anti-sigma factor RsiW